MPMIIITGLPASGKSTVAARLAQTIIEKNGDNSVTVLTDDDGSENSFRQFYGNVVKEKQWRAKQRRTISQLLKKQVIISDNMNYIKGYRYELYCLAKNSQTKTVTIFVDADIEVCRHLNQCREEGADLYSDAKIDELAQRYETPNPNNRWDSPLITIKVSMKDNCLPQAVDIDVEQIMDLLFNSAKVKANECTVTSSEHGVNKMNEIQVITQEIIQAIVEKQNMNLSLGSMMVPHTDKAYSVKKIMNMAQLVRAKAQFMQLVKSNEAIGIKAVGTHFVDFLNTL